VFTSWEVFHGNYLYFDYIYFDYLYVDYFYFVYFHFDSRSIEYKPIIK
jgi:hypothetical protein